MVAGCICLWLEQGAVKLGKRDLLSEVIKLQRKDEDAQRVNED